MSVPLLVIGGPTASGKTRLAVSLARILDGEVISADSMQVYKYMDIGTAKPTEEERGGIPHYMTDIITPDTPYSVCDYASRAKEHIQGIHSRNRLPILAGGTGFYINAVLYDTAFTENASDTAYRDYLQNIAAEKGAFFLYGMLKDADPETAEIIHANNVKRVIRALEYYHLTGERISRHNADERAKKSPYDYMFLAAALPRPLLYENINKRADNMIKNGLTDEVKRLREMGYNETHAPMRGLGYKEIGDYLDGRLTLDEAACNIKQNTRHYAKRQITWFKNKTDARVVDMENLNTNALAARIRDTLKIF